MKEEANKCSNAVVALIRVSSDQQATEDKGGIPAQKFACQNIAKQYGLEIRWWIEIEGVSGAAVKRSPGMQEMLRIVAGGQCTGIVLKEESRLMRPDHFGDYSILETIEKHHCKLYLLDQAIDLSTANGKLWAQLKFGMAGYERSLIRDRMMGGKFAKRSRGEWVGGANSVPYGFTILTKNKMHYLQADEAKIGHVIDLFNLFVSGVTCFTDLARQTGVPYYTITYILRNEIYAGWHVPKKKADPSKNVYKDDGRLRYQHKVVIPVEERERIRIFEDPPISEALFAKAQTLLGMKHAGHWKKEPADTFAYRGTLKCAECGGTIIPITVNNRQANNFHAEYYVCHGAHGNMSHWDKTTQQLTWIAKAGSCPTRRMRREMLEPLLDGIIIERFANEDFLLQLMESYQDENMHEDVEAESRHLQAEITSADKALERNQDMYMRGRIDQQKFDENDDRLKRELATAKTRLRKLKPDVEKITPEQWAPVALQFQRWSKLSPERKRTLLRTVAPVFEIAAYPGEKKRQINVVIKGIRLSFGPEQDCYETLNRKVEWRQIRVPRETNEPGVMIHQINIPQAIETEDLIS